MPRPWTRKNPALSLFLSGANAWAGAARIAWAREAGRRRSSAAKAATKQVADSWAAALGLPAPRGKRRR